MNIKEDNDESVAIEVLQYREKIRGKSGTTHTHRPKSVLFRVGQVVGNLREGYKGVIIGWKIDSKVNRLTLQLWVILGNFSLKYKFVCSCIIIKKKNMLKDFMFFFLICNQVWVSRGGPLV